MIPIIIVRRGMTAHQLGRNARNNPFRVEIADHLAPSQSWIGVLAQEVYEARFKWTRGLIGTQFVRAWRRDMELMGHAIEVAAGVKFDGFDQATYEGIEAYSLSHYTQFHGWTKDRIESELRRRRPAAARWVERNTALLQKWQGKRG